MTTNENVCVGPFKGSLSLQLSDPGREKPCRFSHQDVIWVLFRLWCCRQGSPTWGLDPTFLSGITLGAKNSSYDISAAAHGNPASTLAYPPYSVLVTLCWSCFFCLSMVKRLLSHYCSVFYSGWFFPNLFIIPDWSGEKVSVTSTHPSAILNPLPTPIHSTIMW